MIAPTPGSAASEATASEAAASEAAASEAAAVDQGRVTQNAAPSEAGSRTIPNWDSPEIRARDLLERLGRGDHPDAERDPIYALYQVAVDLRCSAHGYRELYLHHVRHSIASEA